jgi:hypothetical protein
MDTRPKKNFIQGHGLFQITHRYYRDGSSKTFVGNQTPSVTQEIQPYIDFTQSFTEGHYMVRETIDSEWKPLTKKETTLTISLSCPHHVTKNKTCYINQLTTKSVSGRKLDSHKTWFYKFDYSKQSVRRGINPQIVVIKGFRRVPRRWIPEFDEFFGLETPAYPLV